MSAPEFQDRSGLGNPGSARVPRVGSGVSPKQSFPDDPIPRKVRESETLSPTRGTRALPGGLARATWL
jgi:hypothetical protein